MLLKRDHVVNSNYSDFTAYVSACCAIYILHIHWKRTYYAVELIQTCYFRLIILKIELLSTKPPVFCQIIWSKTHKKSSVILRMNLNNLSYKTLINPPCKSIYNTYVIHGYIYYTMEVCVKIHLVNMLFSQNLFGYYNDITIRRESIRLLFTTYI